MQLNRLKILGTVSQCFIHIALTVPCDDDGELHMKTVIFLLQRFIQTTAQSSKGLREMDGMDLFVVYSS